MHVHALSCLRTFGPLAAALLLTCPSPAIDLRVNVGSTRNPVAVGNATDRAVRAFAKQTAEMSSGYVSALRQAGILRTPLTIPVRVVITPDNGQHKSFSRDGGDIVPVFDTSGTRVFPANYQAYLERVFNAAKPVMTTVFGPPASGGTVHVRNYDADIQDRYAVGGGYYIPNGVDGPEIRFPVYSNSVAAGVNYVHTLLLAYMGNKQYPWDAYNEGLVRAATMIVCRTPGALPDSPTTDQIESALTGLYDVGEFYDWFNTPGLGGPQFIAPNLLNTQLPVGGSTGGIFLLRYEMAGTAWAKVAVRYPGFIANLNRKYYADPSAYQTTAKLEALAQLAMNNVSGVPYTKIEGLLFSDWALRQSILDTRLTPGLKLIPTPIPVSAQAGSSDFGVFDIVLNAFQTKSNGDEILLSGSCFPIYWRPDFTRFFASVQDDEIKVAGAYGSVVPNFTGDTFNGQPYRVVVDLPMQGKNARVILPAGAVSTGSDPTFSTFYGTLAGFPAPGTQPYSINLSWVGGSQNAIPVSQSAFGAVITDPSYLAAGPVSVSLVQNGAEVYHREVVKSEGGLGLSIVPDESDTTFKLLRSPKLDMVSLPLEPYRPNPADLLGLSDGDTLFGRWNSNLGRYDLYPAEGEFRGGIGYWVRPPTQASRTIAGRSIPGLPFALSLNPGWNQIGVPLNATFSPSDLLVTFTSEAVTTFDDAVASGDLGTTVFEFIPDPLNPDQGSMAPTTTLTPGKAYYLRVNRPDGGVVIFSPAGGTRGMAMGVQGGHYTLDWEYKVNLTGTQTQTTSVKIGEAVGAHHGYDRGLDSDLPPRMPGVAMEVRNARPMFRDIRQHGVREVFSLDMHGLVPGRRYVMEFRPLTGNKQLLVTYQGRQTTVFGSQNYSFTAAHSDQTILVDTGKW